MVRHLLSIVHGKETRVEKTLGLDPKELCSGKATVELPNFVG
jgi:hypothetical protein